MYFTKMFNLVGGKGPGDAACQNDNLPFTYKVFHNELTVLWKRVKDFVLIVLIIKT
jgi:hypothetical protein